MVIHAFDSAVFGNQLLRRLFADAGNTGNIIGCIAHKGFHVDNLRRRIAVLAPHNGRRHGEHRRNALLCQIDRNPVVDELQCVTVAGNNGNIRIGIRYVFGDSTDDVVPFIPFNFQNTDTQTRQNLPNKGKLRAQFVGSRFTGSLVIGI